MQVGFTEEGARRIAAAVKAVENLGTDPLLGTDPRRHGQQSCLVKLTSAIGHPLWAASEVVHNGTSGFVAPAYGARTWDANTPLLVIGVPENCLVADMVLRAECVGASNGRGYWVAMAYEKRVIDWGTGAQSPFVVESSVLKIKTKVTANGVTWTDEKLSISDEEC